MMKRRLSMDYRNVKKGDIPNNADRCEKIVTDAFKLIYVFLPKCGGRSVKKLLIETYAGYSIEKGFYAIFEERSQLQSYFKFTFTRNPWSRIVSCYENKINTDDAKNLTACVYPYQGLYPRMPFEEFVEWLGTDEGSDTSRKANRHWVSQYLFLTDKNDTLIMDYVGKIATVNKDFKALCQKLDIAFNPVPHVGKNHKEGESDTERYRRYFTNRTRTLIGDRYRKDIELFGYDF